MSSKKTLSISDKELVRVKPSRNERKYELTESSVAEASWSVDPSDAEFQMPLPAWKMINVIALSGNILYAYLLLLHPMHTNGFLLCIYLLILFKTACSSSPIASHIS